MTDEAKIKLKSVITTNRNTRTIQYNKELNKITLDMMSLKTLFYIGEYSL